MNWDAIGAIAETLGAVGVIASLVYLATQIRHSREQMERNTQALRANAYQEIVNQRDNITLSVAQDSEMARMVVRGFAGVENLDAEDSLRFTIWMETLLSGLENTHYQYRMGFLDEDRWGLHHHRLRELMSPPGIDEWWRTSAFRNGPSPEFVALVEEILGEEAGRGE